MLRILLADHHAKPRWALRTLLEEEPDVELVGEAVDMESLWNLSDRLVPDLILIEKELPGGKIEEMISNLHLLDPTPVVIVMSSDPGHARLILKAGADAFVSKGDQADWLLHVLRKYSNRMPKDQSNPTKEKGVIQK